MDNFNFVQAQDFKLAGSGVTLSDTSIILQSLKQIDGSTNLTMSDFGDIGYMVLEPDTSREENISFTGITQNGDGTATLTGVTRGLRFVSPYTQDTAIRKAHAGGTIARVSNTAPFYNELTGKDNDETVTGTWTFTQTAMPRLNTQHSYGAGEEEYLASKRYVDGVALSGAPDSTTTVKGVSELATDAELQAGTATGGSGPLVAGGASFTQTPTANKVPVANSSGKLPSGWGGSASGLATLNGSSKVVENPANAQTTPAASKIPLADGSGKISDGWIGLTTAGDTIYSDGTDLQRLALGGVSEVLAPNSGLTAPSWEYINPSGWFQGFFHYDLGLTVPSINLTNASSTLGAGSAGIPWTRILGTAGAWEGTQYLAGTAGVDTLLFSDAKKAAGQVRARVSSGGDHRLGFGDGAAFVTAYNSTAQEFVGFAIDGTTLYAACCTGAAITLSSAITGFNIGQWLVYRWVLTPGVDAKFYVNGTLQATITTNLPTSGANVRVGFGGDTINEYLDRQTVYVRQEQ